MIEAIDPGFVPRFYHSSPLKYPSRDLQLRSYSDRKNWKAYAAKRFNDIHMAKQIINNKKLRDRHFFRSALWCASSISAWEILGLSTNAEGAEVGSAVRRLSVIWHPDKAHDIDEQGIMNRLEMEKSILRAAPGERWLGADELDVAHQLLLNPENRRYLPLRETSPRLTASSP